MVRIGEAAGRVPAMLETVARTQNDQLTATLSSMTALIQPLLLVIMGGLIAFIMMAVLMPIFDLNTTTF
jgi:type II secretory pathway component PulF